MGRLQRVIVFLGGLGILAMLLYPPWRFRLVVAKGPSGSRTFKAVGVGFARHGRDRLGYALLFDPYNDLDREASRITNRGVAFDPSIDVARLLTQCAAVAAATVMLVAGCSVFHRRDARTERGDAA